MSCKNDLDSNPHCKRLLRPSLRRTKTKKPVPLFSEAKSTGQYEHDAKNNRYIKELENDNKVKITNENEDYEELYSSSQQHDLEYPAFNFFFFLTKTIYRNWIPK